MDKCMVIKTKLPQKRFLLVMFLVISLVLTGCGKTSETDEEIVYLDENNKIVTYELSYPDVPEPYFHDERSGSVFSYKDGYEVEDMDEYYIVYNDSDDGCLLFFSNVDCGTVVDGSVTYACYRELFDRVSVRLKGKKYEITLVDGENTSIETEVIRDTETLVITGNIYVNQTTYPGTFYCTYIDNRPLAVVQVGETEMDAKYVLENTGSVTYSGSPITDHPFEQLATETIEFEGYSMQVPTAWDVITAFDGSIVVQPPVCDKHTLSDCKIIFYRSALDPEDEDYDMTHDFIKTFPSAFMQNPLIDNNRRLTSVTNTIVSKTVNGVYLLQGSFETSCEPKMNTNLRSSLPGRNLSMIICAMESRDDSENAVCVAFSANTFKNKAQMQSLALELIKTIH